MANRITQVPIEVPAKGSPKVRETQAAIEVLAKGSPKVRVTQVAIEVLIYNRTAPVSGTPTPFVFVVT